MFEDRIENLADWVRIRRKARDWSQEELAMASGITKGYVSAIERNAPHSLTGKETTPKVDKIDSIAKALAPSPRLVVQYQNEARTLAGFALIPTETHPLPAFEIHTEQGTYTQHKDGTETVTNADVMAEVKDTKEMIRRLYELLNAKG